MHNFRIGQEVVAIRTHSNGWFTKGEIYPTQGLRASYCGCDSAEINIGIAHRRHMSGCPDCGHEQVEEGGWIWFAVSSFAPLQTESEEADMAEAMEEILERKLFQSK